MDRNALEYKIDVSVHPDRITMRDNINTHKAIVMDLREQATIDALKRLGWLPPSDAATLAADARRWQAVRDGSYELLHNLSTAPAQYREQIIDEVTKI